MTQQKIVKEEQSIGDLFSELANETSLLIRQEISLAQTEMTQKAVKVGKNVGFLAIGGAIGYIGLMAIVAAIIIGLAYFIPLWLSALIVGIVIAIIAAVLISSAIKNLKNAELAPKQTIETLKEDAQWLKKQV